MDLDRMSTGEKIADASAVLLFIFMFFEWFSIDVSGGGLFTISGGANAWESFSVIDIVLLLAVVAAVAVAVVRLTDALFEPPVSLNAIVAVLGGVSVLLILYRIIDPPNFGADAPGVDISPSIGVFLGLIAAAGIAYGGYRAMQEEGTTFSDVGDQLSSGGRGGPGADQPPQSPPPPPPSTPQGRPPPQ